MKTMNLISCIACFFFSSCSILQSNNTTEKHNKEITTIMINQDKESIPMNTPILYKVYILPNGSKKIYNNNKMAIFEKQANTELKVIAEKGDWLEVAIEEIYNAGTAEQCVRSVHWVKYYVKRKDVRKKE